MAKAVATGGRDWQAAVVWAAFLSLLSSIPAKDLEFIPPIWGWDKVAHMVLYGILGVLVFRSVGFRRGAFGLAIILCVAYGLLDEFHQHFIPGRTPSFADLTADTVGAFAGVIVARKRVPGSSNREKRPRSESLSKQ
ncbi:MAG: VanZ family protein [bacterium]